MGIQNKLMNANPSFENIYSRECEIRKVSDENERSIRGVLATELPAIVFDWYKWRAIREVLLIDGMDVPEKMPLLDAHSRWEVSNIKGSVTNATKVNDSKLGTIYEADNIFSSTAEKEFTLAKEGHLTSTSIGYFIYPEKTVEIEYGQEKSVNGKTYKNDYKDKLPLVIRLKSTVFENSLVPIGADKAAKFRSMFIESEENRNDETNNEIEEEKNKQAEIQRKHNERLRHLELLKRK